jgi:hypothetical protein
VVRNEETKPILGCGAPTAGLFVNSGLAKSDKKTANKAEWGFAKKFWWMGRILPKFSKLPTLTSPIRLMIAVTIIKEIWIMQASIEQRRESRSSVSWPVSVWIPEANRFILGRSCNVSKTGVFVTLPVTAPIRTGHHVELNFPRTETLAKEKGQFARIKSGKIVRVDRKNLLQNAEIGVGIAFE